jgi:wyosine [tRNA(Phe)-imidazoG37] synthetase (radical SAM superfamily)
MTNRRQDYVPPGDVITEVEAALNAHRPGEIDWVTFVGSGEPTLHVSLGSMIRQVKELTALPVAVITNGSLAHRPEVRDDLNIADAVMPSLDAGTAELYRKINRPHPELTFERLVGGLSTFRRQYSGKMWLEVMLIKGLNDSEHALRDLARILRDIGPDEVHLSLPIRPPAEPWVAPTDSEGLMRATAILGQGAKVIDPRQGEFDLAGYTDVVDAVINIITRHPMREKDVMSSLNRWAPGEVARALRQLASSGRAKTVTRYGQRFWTAAVARYGLEAGA